MAPWMLVDHCVSYPTTTTTTSKFQLFRVSVILSFVLLALVGFSNVLGEAEVSPPATEDPTEPPAAVPPAEAEPVVATPEELMEPVVPEEEPAAPETPAAVPDTMPTEVEEEEAVPAPPAPIPAVKNVTESDIGGEPAAATTPGKYLFIQRLPVGCWILSQEKYHTISALFVPLGKNQYPATVPSTVQFTFPESVYFSSNPFPIVHVPLAMKACS